jgi:hypothetical protein
MIRRFFALKNSILFNMYFISWHILLFFLVVVTFSRYLFPIHIDNRCVNSNELFLCLSIVCIHWSTSILLCLSVKNEDQTRKRDKYDFVTRLFVFGHYCEWCLSLMVSCSIAFRSKLDLQMVSCCCVSSSRKNNGG